MRLFIAVRFSDEIKKELAKQISAIKEKASYANCTRIENLHLTLAFIGESQRVTDIKKIMDECADGPFSLKLSGSGRFGSLYWVGLEKEPALESIALKLREKLGAAGIPVDKKPFSPHITVAREVVTESPVRLSVSGVGMDVGSICLMRSDRINGKLTYTSVYEKKL